MPRHHLCLLLLLLPLSEDLDEFVHGVRHAKDGEEEDDERLPARLGRGWLGALDGPPVDEVAELAAHRALGRRAAGEEVAHPAHEAEEAEDAAEGVAQLAELLDDADHGEEGRVRRHEGALEHLRDARERLYDRMEEREGVLGRRLEGLGEGGVVGVEGAAGPAHSAGHPAIHARHAAVHPVHAIPSISTAVATVTHAAVHTVHSVRGVGGAVRGAICGAVAVRGVGGVG